MNGILDSARVLLCLFFMIYASWSDFRKREVSNRVWAILAPSAFALTSLQFFMFTPDLLQIYLLSFVVTSALSIAIFYAGAFGGADAKALISLSLALPSYPVDLIEPYSSPVSPLSQTFFPITVFSNAVLLAALSVVYIVARNYVWRTKTGKKLFEGFEKESKWRKILVLLCGYKVDIAELEKKEHLYPLEDFDENEKKLLVVPKDEGREEIVERIRKARSEGRLQNGVWATPGLPMLIFVTLGLVVALIYGDLVW
ncbi:MAG: A24 family peptidase C-terminal domain-containing protein, partial [Candidatus Bathyarchaeia archaeon]